MECSIIFYMAHKTSYCETTLKNILKSNDLTVKSIFPAFSSDMICSCINEACNISDLIFIVGGIDREDENDIKLVLSKGFNGMEQIPVVQKITNPSKGEDAYILSNNGQHIILLPDDPQQIASLLSEKVFGFVKICDIL